MMHDLSGQLKTLLVFAAELISYLPGSVKGGIQYPGPLIKIMRSPGVLGPTEPFYIVGSKGTDIANNALFPLMPKLEQDVIGLKNGMHPELLCLPGAMVEKKLWKAHIKTTNLLDGRYIGLVQLLQEWYRVWEQEFCQYYSI
jgi:hypothetical protein